MQLSLGTRTGRPFWAGCKETNLEGAAQLGCDKGHPSCVNFAESFFVVV